MPAVEPVTNAALSSSFIFILCYGVVSLPNSSSGKGCGLIQVGEKESALPMNLPPRGSGKDAFHRVPFIPGEVWDAVERVLTTFSGLRRVEASGILSCALRP